jgi:hypothetical protein
MSGNSMHIFRFGGGRFFLAMFSLLVAFATPAQTWKPEKQVEIIIGTSAGGPQDRMGRALQRILQEKKLVATPVTVVNKAGGGGAVAMNYLNQHAGDGQFIAVNALATKIAAAFSIGLTFPLLERLGYNPAEHATNTAAATARAKRGADSTMTVATSTTGDVRGTYVPSSATNGIKRLVVVIALPGIATGPNATRTGALGVTQA